MNFTSQSKPRLLMISHCLPEPCGDGQSARAWQLLQMARDSHQVDLACMVHGQVNLNQWRTAAAMTNRLGMETTGPSHRLMGHFVGLINQPAAQQWQWFGTLSNQVGSWKNQNAYDAVVCTHPALWALARSVDANQRLCDMDGSSFAGPNATLLNTTAQNPLAWHAKRLHKQYETLYRNVAQQSDIITASHAPLCDWLCADSSQIFHLPRAVDLDWFNTDAAVPSNHNSIHTPTLMLHADERLRSGKAKWEWFARHVWQKVQQAVPNATWSKSPAATGSTADYLRQASVIVSPQDDPGAGQWAALQSMAMSRPVIASGQALAGMGLRHGEHLLMCQKPSDWVELCVESLRNASVRLKLAQAGREFVETHSIAATAGNLLRTSIARTSTTIPSLALAA